MYLIILLIIITIMGYLLFNNKEQYDEKTLDDNENNLEAEYAWASEYSVPKSFT